MQCENAIRRSRHCNPRMNNKNAVPHTTNGFGSEDGVGLSNGIILEPALHSVSDVAWIEEEYNRLPVDLLDLPRLTEEERGSRAVEGRGDVPLRRPHGHR